MMKLSSHQVTALTVAVLLATLSSCAPYHGSRNSHTADHHHHHYGEDRHGGRVHPGKRDVLVVLDAGHGGEDYGTHSLTKPVQHEKYLTLSTAYMVRDHLKKMGYSVLMTRERDHFIALDKRVEFAYRNKATIFVSLHYNSAPSTQAHGMEIFYYRPKQPSERTKESTALAEAILGRALKNSAAKSRGVKHGNFAVVRDTAMPAVLLEGGFLTNTSELQKIQNPAYVNRIAKGVAEGVDDYVTARLPIGQR